MLPQTEMLAFAGKVNLPLLTDIIAFVCSVSDGSNALKQEAQWGCIFWDGSSDGGAFQKKYGFLYLGELLERYEARFGSSVQDFRAIALAMGYTRELVSDAMFTGSQHRDFLSRLKRSAAGDIYLTGALYLLSTGQDHAGLEEKLLEAETTEDLIFALSLLLSPVSVFQRANAKILRLLGKDRTVPVLGNTKLLS